MISIKSELTGMAQRLIEYYPMLQDKSAASGAEWEPEKKQLLKRLQNVTTPKKKPLQERGHEASVFRAARRRTTSETTESLQNQVRHYKILQEMYKTKARPNKKDVSHLLDIEFQARRAFIDSDAIKEQDRPTKILQPYPCFRELDHIMDELRRILDRGNSHFIPDLKTRWGTFYEQTHEALTCHDKGFTDMFPSPVAPPKKLGHASEAMFHVLESKEDPHTFLQTRPLFSPVVIVCETSCLLPTGTMPVVTFPKEDIYASVMYLMACYYAFRLTYPKCIATMFSVLQTEVLLYAIHDKDMTSSYKKSMFEWKKFITD
ncbi:hypothetical protein QTP86_022671 [Hemibagrus guttatus]|nr:hypothetical protein QTP86_022671 [Hemibagrus guttatus]